MLRGVFWVVDGELLAFPFRSGAPYGAAKAGNTYTPACFGIMSNLAAARNHSTIILAAESKSPGRACRSSI